MPYKIIMGQSPKTETRRKQRKKKGEESTVGFGLLLALLVSHKQHGSPLVRHHSFIGVCVCVC